jgi:hypothetical protein
MPKAARRTWQQAERRVAALFGARRQVGSGAGGREDLTASDSNHPALFIESKLRRRHTTRTLHDETKRLATKEGKTPVLALFDKNRPGFLVVTHSDDQMTVAAEFVVSLGDEESRRFISMVREARNHSRAKPEAS